MIPFFEGLINFYDAAWPFRSFAMGSTDVKQKNKYIENESKTNAFDEYINCVHENICLDSISDFFISVRIFFYCMSNLSQ